MRSFLVCCVLAGGLMLAGCGGGDGAKKTLEGSWNCSNFITVRVDTARMLMTPVAVFGIPVPADDPDMTPLKFTLKNITGDSLEMGAEDEKETMRIHFPDANTAEVSLNASKRELEELKAQLPGFDGTFTCKRVK